MAKGRIRSRGFRDCRGPDSWRRRNRLRWQAIRPYLRDRFPNATLQPRPRAPLSFHPFAKYLDPAQEHVCHRVIGLFSSEEGLRIPTVAHTSVWKIAKLMTMVWTRKKMA